MECQFCGSKNIKIETPYIDRAGQKITNFCCLAQKKNQSYITKRTSRWSGNKPNTEDVGKW